MSNLLASLGESASALSVFQLALDTVQSNVTNASTPGYARQTQLLEAAPFDPAHGLIGGVRDGGTESARDEYSEQAVRGQANAQGQYQALAAALSQIENVFNVSGDGGIPGALDKLYQSFSAWSVTPNDDSAKSSVLLAAGDVATAFHQTANQIGQARAAVDGNIDSTLDDINGIAERIRQYNVEVLNGQSDAVLDARLYSNLEDLSQYVDFTVVRQNDGTATVLLGGQIPLVMGDKAVSLTKGSDPNASTTRPGAVPPVHIFAGDEDLDGIISGGKLGGLLQVRNDIIPSLIGDTEQDGQLNILADEFAKSVNGTLDPSGATQLFTTGGTVFGAAAALDANASAALNAGVAGTNGNGIALALAGLRNSAGATLGGMTFTGYYAAVAADLGTRSATAKDQQDLYTRLAAQARNLRQQVSGVSLDQEAAMLLQFQRAYQAAARLVSVLNELTETVVNLGR